MRPATKDKVALERSETAARRRGTTPPATSRCRPPHPCAHRDSGEDAVGGCTGNAAGRVEQGVKEHGRDDARDEHDRIHGPLQIDRVPWHSPRVTQLVVHATTTIATLGHIGGQSRRIDLGPATKRSYIQCRDGAGISKVVSDGAAASGRDATARGGSAGAGPRVATRRCLR